MVILVSSAVGKFLKIDCNVYDMLLSLITHIYLYTVYDYWLV